jgi:hypothetical protein
MLYIKRLQFTGEVETSSLPYVNLRKPVAARPVMRMLVRMTGKGCSDTNLPHLAK